LQSRLPESLRVFDTENAAITEAVVTAAWLDASTLHVVVELPDGDRAVTRARIELAVRTQDADGNTTATFDHTAKLGKQLRPILGLKPA
jgi:hypothetical protein